MGIEQVYKVQDTDTQKALEHLAGLAVGLQTTETEPDVKTVPFGVVVVYDDGTTKRLYVRTGKDRIGYITLT